jgi:hypothetical protein
MNLTKLSAITSAAMAALVAAPATAHADPVPTTDEVMSTFRAERLHSENESDAEFRHWRSGAGASGRGWWWSVAGWLSDNVKTSFVAARSPSVR